MTKLSWIERFSHSLFVRVWASRLKRDPMLTEALARYLKQNDVPEHFIDAREPLSNAQSSAAFQADPDNSEMTSPQVLLFPAQNARGVGDLHEQPTQPYCVIRSKKQLGLVELKN